VSTRSVGGQAEQRAARFLEAQGYRILERNYACRLGEIDIVAEEGDVLCFVEVRWRARSRYGYPEESIGRDKKRRISVTARQYLVERKIEGRGCRFDVVSILGDDEPVLQRDAFESDYYSI
jgi:putative endonuclease